MLLSLMIVAIVIANPYPGAPHSGGGGRGGGAAVYKAPVAVFLSDSRESFESYERRGYYGGGGGHGAGGHGGKAGSYRYKGY